MTRTRTALAIAAATLAITAASASAVIPHDGTHATTTLEASVPSATAACARVGSVFSFQRFMCHRLMAITANERDNIGRQPRDTAHG